MDDGEDEVDGRLEGDELVEGRFVGERVRGEGAERSVGYIDGLEEGVSVSDVCKDPVGAMVAILLFFSLSIIRRRRNRSS